MPKGTNLKVLPPIPTKVPKPRIPKSVQPPGGGTGQPDPEVSVRNSQKGVKQRVAINLPGIKT